MIAVHKYTDSDDGLEFFDLINEDIPWQDYFGIKVANIHGHFVAHTKEFSDYYYGVGRTPDAALAQLTAHL